MKNNNFQKGIEEIQDVKLSSKEKGDMLHTFSQHIKENPISDRIWHESIFFYVRTSRYAHVALVLLAVLFVGGNIAYAAEKALPGDTLYPVKIYVNEKVQSAVRVTPGAKVKYEEEKVIKRLDEVESLVEKGKFDTEKRTQVQKEVEKSVKFLEKNNTVHDVKFEEKVEAKFDKHLEKIDKGNNGQKEEVKKLKEDFKEKINYGNGRNK